MYKNKKIIKNKRERKQILRKCHDDRMTEHLNIREILKRVKEITF